MQYKNAAIIAGLAAQQVAAFGWTDASSYSCPGNTNNHCSNQQQGGYDWSGLGTGSFSSYGSNSFSGFSCSNSFGKRDLLSKRGFQSKCITGNLDDSPSMSCGNHDSMTIDTMHVSSSQNTDVDCEYSMPDGSTCHETHSCSVGGSIFQNTQCGGAKSVTFKPGSNAPSGCSIGVHSVGFHCGPPSSSVPPYSPSTSSVPAPSSSAPVSSSAPGCYGGSCSSSVPASSSAPCYGNSCSSSVVVPSSPTPCYGDSCSTTVPLSTSPVTSSAPCYGASCSSSAPVPGCYGGGCSSSSVVPVSSSAPVPGCYGGGCSSSVPVSTSPVTSSAPAPGCYGGACSSSVVPVSSSAPVPGCYGGDCSSSSVVPVSSSAPAPGCYGGACSSSSVIPVSSSAPAPGCYGSSCSSGSFSPVSSSASCYGASCSSSSQSVPVYGSSSSSVVVPVSSSSAPGPYPTPNCPGLLPRCLNTWMYMSGCKDNADANCFCGNEKFIKNVMGCISAWSGSDSETQAAASYLMGLCASHVSTNPAIITACPSTVTPGPSPSPVDYSSSAVGYSSSAVGYSSSAVGYSSSAVGYSSSAVGYSSSAVGYSSSAVGYSSSSPASPVTSEALGKPAPCTTITYSSPVVVPGTYTTGVSSGFTIPGSSYTTTLVTTVTVPEVSTKMDNFCFKTFINHVHDRSNSPQTPSRSLEKPPAPSASEPATQAPYQPTQLQRQAPVRMAAALHLASLLHQLALALPLAPAGAPQLRAHPAATRSFPPLVQAGRLGPAW